MKKMLVGLAAVSLLVAGTAAQADAASRTYRNCTALNKDYKHGVGRVGAHDKTSGKPVVGFTHNTSLYNANKKSDRDKDGIACEKR